MNQAHAARPAHRLDSNSNEHIVFFGRTDFLPKLGRFLARPESDFVELFWKLFRKKIENLLRLRRAGGVLDAGVNVFRVLAKDHHVHFLRMLHGGGDTLKVLDGPETNEKIEQLPERDVERTNAAAHWRGQRTFDADQVFAKRFDGVLRQPIVELVFRHLTSEDLKPGDFLFAAIGFFNCCVKHSHTRRPNVRPGAIATDERNYRTIRYI